MKKIMRISLNDGRTFERDVTEIPFYDQSGKPTKPLIGAPMTDPLYMRAAFAIATGGYNDPASTDDHFIFIAPSQIRQVEFLKTILKNDAPSDAGIETTPMRKL